MKTNELTGAALDWAVAKCEGFTYEYDSDQNDFWINRTNDAQQFLPPFGYLKESFFPSSCWEQGGEIIEREDIAFRKYHNPAHANHGLYYARICRESGTLVGWYRVTGHQQTGPTPLIAAMRCYVASKLGHEVNLPEELK